MDRPGHVPVLLREVVAILRPELGGVYVDATVGLGGHAEALLAASDEVRVVGIDRDPEALALASRRLERFGNRFVPVEGRHEEIAEHLGRLGLRDVAGILADLGVSSMQLDDPARGFSFRREGPLDMRMGRGGETAADLVANLGQEELARIFREYGEERMAGRIARAVVTSRRTAPILTTTHLRDVVISVTGRRREERIDPATRVFQALRIAVNGELDALEVALDAAVALLRPGGRLVVLAYHSLEDRLVKRFVAAERRGCTCPPSFPVCVCGRAPRLRPVGHQPAVPSEAEVAANPRARSARLRTAERLAA